MAPHRDRPWLMRTYSGHSSAKASNELYRTDLVKGQTGLSVAFDLPTQTGYDADHPLARGELGKVGVPVCSIDDVRTLFAGLPLGDMKAPRVRAPVGRAVPHLTPTRWPVDWPCQGKGRRHTLTDPWPDR